MTRNKKKLRRLERLAGAAKSNGRGVAARSLIVSGALIGGLLAAPAWAAEAPAAVELMAGQTANITTVTPISTYTVNGGELTINGTTTSARLQYDPANENDASLFVMRDGTAAITGGNVDVGRVEVSGGLINLTGTASAWREAAYLGGYGGLTVSGGTVNMGKNSEMFIGSTKDLTAQGSVMTLSGGTINMLGTGADYNAAHIWAGSYGAERAPNKLLLSGATINVGDGGTGAKYGIINSGDTAMSGGEINVNNGTLRIQANIESDNTLWTDASKIPERQAEGVWAMTGGKLTVNKGMVQSLLKDFSVTGGTVNLVDGHLDNEFTTIGGNAVVNLSGTSDAWDSAAYVGGYGGLTINGNAEINMGANSELFTGKTSIANAENGGAGTLKIAGGAVNMLGLDSGTDAFGAKSAHIWAGSDATNNKIEISGGAINVGNGGGVKHYGVISSKKTAMSGGSINVAQDGILALQGSVASKGGAVTDLLGGQHDGEWIMTGGSFNAGNGLTVSDLAKFSVNGGTFTANELVLDQSYSADGKNGTFAVISGSGTSFTVDGGAASVNNLSVKASDATLTVNGGTLSVTHTLENGASTITVSGGLLSLNGDKVLSADAKGLASGVSQITVSGGGTVGVALSSPKTLTLTELGNTQTALVGSGGKWSITGVTVSDMADHVTSTPTADGGSANVISDTDSITVGDAIAKDYAVATGHTGGAASLTNSSTSGTLAVTGAQLNEGDTLTITTTGTNGSNTIIGNGGALVQGAGAAKTDIKVADTGTLQLGSPAVAGGGTLNGKIVADTGTANVIVGNGAFAVESIDLSAATTSSTLTVGENGALAVSGDVTAKTLEVSGGVLSAVAQSGAPHTVTAEEAHLANAGLSADAVNLGVAGASASEVANSRLSAKSLALTDQTTLTIGSGSVVTAEALDAGGSQSTITVGDASGAAHLIAGGVSLKGATLSFDPPFIAAGDTSNASTGSLSFAGNSIDGLITVGQNSMVAIGSHNADWLRQQVTTLQNDGAVLWGGDVTAALALSGNQKLDAAGGLVVDGTWTNGGSVVSAVSNQVRFADKSLLLVDASSLGSGAALSDNGSSTLTVDAGAKLALVNGLTGDNYTLMDNFSSVALNGWQGADLLSTSYLQSVSVSSDGHNVVAAVNPLSAKDVLPGISSGMASLVDSLYLNKLNSTTSANAGVKLVSRATDKVFVPAADSARILESGAQLALLGGAPLAAFDAADAASAAVNQRTSMAVPSAQGVAADAGQGFGIWATPLFRSSELKNQNVEGFKYGVDSKLYGGAIGADMTNGNLRYGLAFNVGSGDADTKGGDLYHTENDFDFWGFTAYSGWRYDNFGLSGEFGYTNMSNDIKQDLDARLGMGSRLNADVHADLYSAGLKAEYRIATALVDITPSVGARFHAYRQGNHDVNSADGTVFRMDDTDMNTWTFPLAVTFSKDFNAGNWNISPALRLAVIPVAGDKDLESKASLPGLNVRSANLKGEVFDSTSGEIGLGLNLSNDNITFGLDYGFQGSADYRSHSLFGTFRYSF